MRATLATRFDGSVDISAIGLGHWDPATQTNQPHLLGSVPAARRKTLIAVREGRRGGRQTYRFDIRMQGPEETVFFDL